MVNRLAEASSPYLRQHRDNPVHWYQWGREAFDEAERSGKPILLSVGYSACHWCHVMAHESFEDDEVAAVMNALFVNVKVDREERPDVDAVYMDAVQALTGRGGWPMTVFCTPAGEPFYGGTYYPRESFLRLMSAVDDAWKNRRAELNQNVEALVEAIGRTSLIEPSDDIDVAELHRLVIRELVQRYDRQWGGFGSAPKFPSTFALDTLLRFHQISGSPDALEIVTTSLDAMASGGMYDHLGGGFARYSVDQQWLVPHFEKMLYDQALLIRVYLHAWLVTGLDRHRQVVAECVEYVLRDLTTPDGAFCSSEDADSPDEHGHSEEGAFYTFSIPEIRSTLGDSADAAIEWWEMSEEGNFEGRNIPSRLNHRGQLERPDEIESSRRALFEARNRRPRPGLDDKVLLEWNAMMLSTLCEVAAAFDDPALVAAVVDNADFLCGELRDTEGRWMRSWQAGASPRLRHSALAHDKAHVVDALTRVYELTGEARYLDIATQTAHGLIQDHWDDAHGGLFTVASDAEQLIVRQKDLMDNATPSSHSVAALAFLRLSALTGDADIADRARDILRLLARVLPSAPSAFCNAMAAMELLQQGLVEVVIPGRQPDLVKVVREQWRPAVVLAFGDPFDSPLWTERIEGHAYVCRGHECLLPASNVDELRDRLLTSANGG